MSRYRLRRELCCQAAGQCCGRQGDAAAAEEGTDAFERFVNLLARRILALANLKPNLAISEPLVEVKHDGFAIYFGQ